MQKNKSGLVGTPNAALPQTVEQHATCHLMTTTCHLPTTICNFLPEFLFTPDFFSLRIFFLPETFFDRRLRVVLVDRLTGHYCEDRLRELEQTWNPSWMHRLGTVHVGCKSRLELTSRSRRTWGNS